MLIRKKDWIEQAKNWQEITRFNALKDERHFAERDLHTAEQIAYTKDERYLSYKQSPEEILIDKERSALIKDFWNKLDDKLTVDEYLALRLYVYYGGNASKVARKINKDEKQVRRYLIYVKRKAEELLDELGLMREDLKDLLIPRINLALPHKARGVGYPFEKYLSLPKNKRWTFRYGSIKSPITKSCMIPEYLKASGSCSICNICSESKTCTRCDAFPENAETEAQRKHAIYIQNVLSDIKLTYSPKDFVGLERRVSI